MIVRIIFYYEQLVKLKVIINLLHSVSHSSSHFEPQTTDFLLSVQGKNQQ